ncbi:MAG: peptidase [Rhodothermaceae bacterium]|nr:peptidase [Rhodothermaceae bacterium]
MLPSTLIRPSSVLFVFLDGVGLGEADRAINPLAAHPLPAFEHLAGGAPWTAETPLVSAADHVVRPIDATLGVEGLPQSGTGQATLFSGVNCAALAGRHYGPYPHSTSKPILREQSIFARLLGAGHETEHLAFANAYPERFFVHAWERKRWTVTTYACRKAGIRLRTTEELRQGDALAAGITNALWRTHLDPSMPEVHEEEGARRLARFAEHHPFTLFEYYLTDKAGHAQDAAQAESILRTLDRFFGALLDLLDFKRTLLVVSSDHGNLEDLSIKTHTRHPVPLIAHGVGASALAEATSLTDVTPALVPLLGPTKTGA